VRKVPSRALTLAALLATAGLGAPAGEARADAAKAPVQQLCGRGVFFFDGPKRSPMAGLGQRGEFASNRVALDDVVTTATWDANARKLVIRNTAAYEDETQVACVLLLGTARSTLTEQEVPVGVHLMVYKDEEEFVTTIHGHVVVREAVHHPDLLGIQVVLDDGRTRTVALTLSTALQALKEPFQDSAAARLIGLVGVDNLEGQEVDITRPGARLADGSVGMGRGFLTKLVLRAQLIALDGARPIPPGTPWTDVFRTGGYELRLTALSSFLPQEPWPRNLFLLGLDEIPILRPLAENGLEDGQTLSFTFREGKGTITLGDRSAPVEDAPEAVRRYLEFDFVGGIIRYQLEQRLMRAAERAN
jgi:hypothetical protein